MEKVSVSAPARIHMGILNPSREIGDRLYASVGVGILQPRTIVEVQRSDGLKVRGPRLDESKKFATKVLNYFKLKGAEIDVLTTPPQHAGLGSTTQLSLSIAAGIVKAYGLDAEPVELAVILKRGEQSATGTYVFQHGGFVVEGGWGCKTTFPPLLFHYSVPEDWRFLIVIPKNRSFDEKQELDVFRKLPKPKKDLVYEACYRILLGMAPAVLEKNIESFGANLTKLQELVGAVFSEAQDGVFEPHSAPLIRKLKEMGASGVGQSSWGPAVYALFPGKLGINLEGLLKKKLMCEEITKDSDGNLHGSSDFLDVYFTRTDNKGALVSILK
ncbi:MAG: beta-ribofuranosylaminobenzene 5'-phosphate synthase family protein [Candidatus Atabeyarchaeum deiterrae]